MTTRPAAVLFDADGVLQYPPAAWTELLAGAAEGFVPRLLAVERPFLEGDGGDFRPVLDDLLERERREHGATLTSEDFLAAWTAFRPDPAALDVVREVRAAGVRTILATNQQAVRAAMMHDGGWYDDVMDEQFFSYRLGAMKPDAAYFEAILAATDLTAGDVLFVDDVEVNVAGALAVGLRARHKPEPDGVAGLRRVLVEEGVLDA